MDSFYDELRDSQRAIRSAVSFWWPVVQPCSGFSTKPQWSILPIASTSLLSRQNLRRMCSGCRKQGVIHQGQPFFHDLQAVAEFLFIDDERRANPQHIEAAECVEMLALQVLGELVHLRAIAIERG